MKMNIFFSEAKPLLFCLKPDHFQESIDYFCSDFQCKQSTRFCCYLCKHEEKHEMASLKVILSTLLQIEQIGESSLRKSANVDMKLQIISEILNKNRKELQNEKLVFSSFQNYTTRTKNNALKVFQLNQQLLAIPRESPHQFQKQLSRFLIQNFDYLVTDEEKGQESEKESGCYDNTLQNLETEIDNIIKELQKLAQSKKIEDYNVLSLFPYEEAGRGRAFKVHFSEDLMASCMKIEGKSVTMTVAGQQRVVGMQPCLQSNFKVKRWKIKIVKLASWIGVGVCHIKKAKEANWNFNYSNTGHGTYYLSSNGYSWSSYKPEFNSKHGSFSFKSDDIICLEYNPRERVLRFQKQDTELTFTLEIENNGDPLHPSVNLTGMNDCVEVFQ